MIYQLSCPSKTFLLGEYLVLNEGMALIMSTTPRFELVIKTDGTGIVDGFVPESPAGQWIRQNRLFFQNVDVQFLDPHMGRGGFGASSAQYLLSHVATQVLKNPKKGTEFNPEDFKIEQIWRAYRQLETVSAEGLRASGADLVGQFVGGLCKFHMEPFRAKAFRFPFADYDVVLVYTGAKLPTHEHLRGLKRINTDELGWIYSRAVETLAVGDAPAFFDSVNDYYAELLEMGLVAEHTQVIVTTLLSKPFVAAAKGCGAMGSDVVAIFIAKENRDRLNSCLREMKLSVATDVSCLDRGLQVQMATQMKGVDIEP